MLDAGYWMLDIRNSYGLASSWYPASGIMAWSTVAVQRMLFIR